MALTKLDYVLWVSAVALELIVFGLALYRGTHHRMPIFTTYLGLVLTREAIQLVLLSRVGSASTLYLYSLWSMQALLITARALVVGELCRGVFGRYRGVWLFARWILGLTAALLVTSAAIQASGRVDRPYIFVPAIERGLEVAIVGVLLLWLMVCRYYNVPVRPLMSGVAFGLGLYSSVAIVNNTVLSVVFAQYSPVWVVVRSLSFQVAVLIWVWALLRPLPLTDAEPMLAGADLYARITPEVSDKMRDLNQRVLAFLKR